MALLLDAAAACARKEATLGMRPSDMLAVFFVDDV